MTKKVVNGKANSVENNVIKEIENSTKGQTKKVVKYKDNSGKNKEITITMRRLGARDRAKIQHYLNAGNNTVDFGDAIEALLDKALVFPHLTFKDVNEDIEKNNISDQTIEYEDYDGNHQKFIFHFTNVKDMLNLLRNVSGANFSNELEQFFDLATELNAIKSIDNNKTLSLDDFDDAKHIDEVASNIINAIAKVLNTNGFLNIIIELQKFFHNN